MSKIDLDINFDYKDDVEFAKSLKKSLIACFFISFTTVVFGALIFAIAFNGEYFDELFNNLAKFLLL